MKECGDLQRYAVHRATFWIPENGWTQKRWPEAGPMILARRLVSGLDPFGKNLTQSARRKSDTGRFCTLRSGPSVEDCSRVRKWKTGSGPVAFCQNRARWFLHTSLLPDQICWAKSWPGHPDRIRAGFVQYDQAFFGRMDPNQIREVGSGIYDQTQL